MPITHLLSYFLSVPWFLQVEKSFLQNEGGGRDGLNYEKGYQEEGASAENKYHAPIPTSFFLLQSG